MKAENGTITLTRDQEPTLVDQLKGVESWEKTWLVPQLSAVQHMTRSPVDMWRVGAVLRDLSDPTSWLLSAMLDEVCMSIFRSQQG